MVNKILAEVFGYLPSDNSENAKKARSFKLCPFHNKVPNCTKNDATNPLGVCSILYKQQRIITCPIRFTEGWDFTIHAAEFFFQ